MARKTISAANVNTFVSSLLENEEWKELTNELKVHPNYTGNYGGLLKSTGFFGLVPITGYSNGDIAALRYDFKKPFPNWQVYRVSHNTYNAEIIASSFQSFIACHSVLCYFPYNQLQIDEASQKLKQLSDFAEFLGEKGKKTKRVIDGITTNLITENSDYFQLFEVAEGDRSMISQFYTAYKQIFVEGADALETIKAYLKKYPDFEPAIQLYFGICKKINAKETVDVAWKIVNLNQAFDNSNSFKALRKNGTTGGYKIENPELFDYLFDGKAFNDACKFLYENPGKRYNKLIVWKIVEARAKNEPLSDIWCELGDEMFENMNYKEAFIAYQNAAYFAFEEEGEVKDCAIRGAQHCAKMLNDENLRMILPELKDDGNEVQIQLNKDLQYAIVVSQDFEKVKSLIAQGADIEWGDEFHETCLYKAVTSDLKDILIYLIEQGANLEAQSEDKYTSLNIALLYSKPELAKILIEAGANPNTPDNDGITPLFRACSSEWPELIDLLLKNNGNIKHITNTGENILFFCVNYGYKNLILQFIEAGIDLQHKNNEGKTILMEASRYNNPEIVQFLLDLGCNPKETDNEGRTALDYAKEEKCTAVIKILKKC